MGRVGHPVASPYPFWPILSVPAWTPDSRTWALGDSGCDVLRPHVIAMEDARLRQAVTQSWSTSLPYPNRP